MDNKIEYHREPDGLYVVEYVQKSKVKAIDADDFVNWFIETAVQDLKEVIENWRYDRTMMTINSDYFLAKKISEYLTKKGFLPKKID